MSKLRPLVGWTLRLGLVAACVVYALHGVEWTVTSQSVRAYSWPRIAFAVAFSGLAYALLGLRLHLLSRGELRAKQGFQACMIGVALNNLLPAKLGELAKALFLRRAQGWPFARSLALVFWERLLDLNMVLVVALLAAALLGVEIALWPLALVGAVLWVAVLALRRWPSLGARLIDRVPLRSARELLREISRQIATGLDSRALLAGALCTVAIWLTYAGTAWIALVWIAGLPLGLPETLTVFAVSALGVAVPSAPGNVGVFEAAVVVSLGWFGVSKSEALPIAVVYHLIALVPSTLLGLTFLALANLGVAELWAERRARRGRPQPSSEPGGGTTAPSRRI